MVRLLPRGLARREHLGELLLRREPDRRLHLHPPRLRRGLCGAPLRRAVLRPPRRPHRAQIHLPRHDDRHGHRDLRRRPAAGLCHDRHRGPGPVHRLPAAAGPGAWRRVWRRRDLRRRARPAGTARLLHVVDPDDRDRRPVPVAPRHPRPAPGHDAGSVRGLGLADAVPGLDPAACGVDLDPAAARRNRRPSPR